MKNNYNNKSEAKLVYQEENRFHIDKHNHQNEVGSP